MLTLRAWPDSRAEAHWRGGAAAFLVGARRSFIPLMRQRIDPGELYADALYGVRAGADDASQGRALPDACPFGLDGLIGKRPDVAALVGRLGEA